MSHAPMLGPTLLDTALTRARQLVVIVGQRKALYLAVRDWRRAPRHTALGRLLDATLRFNWGRTGGEAGEPWSVLEEALWEGNGEGMSQTDVTVETTVGPL